MQGMPISYIKCDGMLFQFNLPVHPKMTLGGYVRECRPMVAAPNVTWQDILAELHSKEDDDSAGLDTVTIFVHWYIVSMTVGGFKNAGCDSRVNLAKELIAYREFDANGGYDNRGHKWQDYWPKD